MSAIFPTSLSSLFNTNNINSEKLFKEYRYYFNIFAYISMTMKSIFPYPFVILI